MVRVEYLEGGKVRSFIGRHFRTYLGRTEAENLVVWYLPGTHVRALWRNQILRVSSVVEAATSKQPKEPVFRLEG